MAEFHTCKTCRFYKGRFGLEPKCINPKCIQKGFTSLPDIIDGSTTTYPDSQPTCFYARLGPCGGSGSLWEAKP